MLDKNWKYTPSPTRYHRVGVGLVPFTGGLIVFVYAFFWPEGYGRWLGTIVKAFRDASGI